MADNTTLNLGSGGDVIASDDIGGVKYQRVKVTFGADGSATDVSTSSGLPVSAQIFDSQLNQTGMVTQMRHLVAGQYVRMFGDSFANGMGVGEEDAGAFPLSATVTGTATGTSTGGQYVMSTGATAGATGVLQSVEINSMLTGATMQVQNGMSWPSANLTAFRVVSRKAGTDTVIESSAFNVVPTPITNSGLSNAAAGTLVDGNLHRCDIFYQGNSAIFSVDGVVVHRMPAAIASPRTESLDFPTRFDWFSTATPNATLRAGAYDVNNGYFFECQYNVANVTIGCRGTAASRIGPPPRAQKVKLKNVTFKGGAAAFRTVGAAALLQNVLTIENAASSGVHVTVSSLSIMLDATAVLTAVMPLTKLSRLAALPTGGTVLTKVPLDTMMTSAAGVVIRGDAASDGGALTTITATAGATLSQIYNMRMHTAVGQVLGDARNLIHTDSDHIEVHPGEALLIQVVAAATASNPATNHWAASVEWEEYTV